MGLVIVAFGIGTVEGVYAALFLMLNHAVIKPLLFFSGSYLVFNSKDKQISEMNGLGKYMPVTGAFFALGAFAIVGLPPFAGFWSKLSILSAAANEGLLLIIALILIVSIVEIVYYFRVVNRIFFQDYSKQQSVVPHHPRFNALIAMFALAVLILVIGFYPDAVTGILHNASNDLINKNEYINDVLQAGQSLTH
jgi:formate hydrogenlyase subunit 3/multisubunit Na+/H+ antiporter MnhD subunit